jgi:hypothetical protein
VGRLLDNLPMKAASLAIATVLWFVIAGQKTSERAITAPVELQNFPLNLELTGDAVDSVEVRLRASPGIIQGLGPSDLSARINVAGAQEGERIIHLTPESIRAPFGVRVVKITPSILTLNFERTLQKEVPVRPRIIGRPAPGHEVAEVASVPAEVRIAGPKSRVQEIESAFTEPISVEGAETSVTDEVSIGLEDPLLRLQTSSRVKVTARIREEHGKRTFEALPVEVRGPAGRASQAGPVGQARPAAVRVVVAGPLSALRQLQPSRVHPYVTVVGALAGAARLPVAVELASGLAGVSVVTIDPAQVAVRPSRTRGAP